MAILEGARASRCAKRAARCVRHCAVRVVGLLLGVGAATAIEAFGPRRLRSEREVAGALPIPIVAGCPAIAGVVNRGGSRGDRGGIGGLPAVLLAAGVEEPQDRRDVQRFRRGWQEYRLGGLRPVTGGAGHSVAVVGVNGSAGWLAALLGGQSASDEEDDEPAPWVLGMPLRLVRRELKISSPRARARRSLEDGRKGRRRAGHGCARHRRVRPHRCPGLVDGDGSPRRSSPRRISSSSWSASTAQRTRGRAQPRMSAAAFPGTRRLHPSRCLRRMRLPGSIVLALDPSPRAAGRTPQPVTTVRATRASAIRGTPKRSTPTRNPKPQLPCISK